METEILVNDELCKKIGKITGKFHELGFSIHGFKPILR